MSCIFSIKKLKSSYEFNIRDSHRLENRTLIKSIIWLLRGKSTEFEARKMRIKS